MLTEWFVKTGFGGRLVRRMQRNRTEDIVGDLAPLLRKGERILDIGAGGCTVAAGLRELGHDIHPVDIRDQSCVPSLRPQLYDGERLPFTDQSFDVALLITVLHHIADPDQTLREAQRVAKRLIIQEDLYNSTWQRYATYAMDSLLNLEFFGHPHTNRNDAGWRAAFARLGGTVLFFGQKPFWKIFRSGTYVVQSRTESPIRPVKIR